MESWARQRQHWNAAPSSRRIASPEINPVGKLSPEVGHELMVLLLCRKAFGKVLKTPKTSQTSHGSYLLFTSNLCYLRVVSKLDTELFLGAGWGFVGSLWVRLVRATLGRWCFSLHAKSTRNPSTYFSTSYILLSFVAEGDCIPSSHLSSQPSGLVAEVLPCSRVPVQAFPALSCPKRTATQFIPRPLPCLFLSLCFQPIEVSSPASHPLLAQILVLIKTLISWAVALPA